MLRWFRANVKILHILRSIFSISHQYKAHCQRQRSITKYKQFVGQQDSSNIRLTNRLPMGWKIIILPSSYHRISHRNWCGNIVYHNRLGNLIVKQFGGGGRWRECSLPRPGRNFSVKNVINSRHLKSVLLVDYPRPGFLRERRQNIMITASLHGTSPLIESLIVKNCVCHINN